ncbi:MAG: aminotransferase class IV [Nitrospinae bacterium]|nr:aminotransferase class IV [Nitrospinota bacterium]
MSELVIINGVETAEARIGADDRGFLLGDGLFETIPLYGGIPFALTDHLSRMRRGAALLELAVPFACGDIADGITSLARRNGVTRGAARLTLTRGVGPRGYGIEGCGPPTWLLTVRPCTPLPAGRWERGYTLAPSRIAVNPRSPLASAKTTSALERVLRFAEARRAGADEALALTLDGNVACGAAVNLFWARGGTLYTPSEACGILPGVTRAIVSRLAADEGITVREGAFPPAELYGADEVFATNSLLELMPVTAAQGHFTGKAPGPLARALHKRYRELPPEA